MGFTQHKNFRGIQTALVASTLALSLTSATTFAQIGPVAPEEMPSKPASQEEGNSFNNLKSGFKKLFQKPSLEGEKTEGNTSTESLQKPEPTPAPAPAPAAEANKRPPLLTQPKLTKPMVEEPEVADDQPKVKETARLDNPDNPLGLARSRQQMNTCIKQYKMGDVTGASSCFTTLRPWLTDSTEAHIGLYKTLNQIPSARAQAELEKQLALEFALLRDQIFYYMGQIYVQRQDFSKAIKELTEVIKSQPRSEMGLKAYEILQEIGFTTKLQIAE